MILWSLIQRLNDCINSSMREIKKIFFLMEKSLDPSERKTEDWKAIPLLFCLWFFASYQNQKQADIVWFGSKDPYDLAFGFIRFPRAQIWKKGRCVSQANLLRSGQGLFMPLILMGKLWSNVFLREANGVRPVSLNKKYSDQIIPLDEEPGVIGKVIDGFVPLNLEEIKWFN